MKKLTLFVLLPLLIGLATGVASAQNTTVSGTVTDSDSIAWANGTINFTLTASTQNLYCSGTQITPSQANVTINLDGTGAFSTSICSNSNITPVSSQWAVSVCSATTAPCQNLGTTTISGSTQNLTSFIASSIKPIRIPISFGTRAYADGEIVTPPIGGTYFNLINSVNRTWNGTSWSSSSPSTGSIGYCNAPGMKCDGVTDDTTAFQNLLNSVSAAGGGVIQGTAGKTSLILGQINIPAALTTPWAMPPIRITGTNSSFGGSNNPTTAPPGTPFVLDMRFAGSRFLSLGQGTLEIDHVTFVNGSTNCGTLIQSTLTNLKLHDNAIWGSVLNGGGTSSCDNVWLAGGTNGTNIPLGGTTADFFQGYGSVIQSNWSDYIRSFITGRVAFNSIPIVNNTIWNHSGSNATGSVTAATNANPSVLTSTGHNFPVGTGITLTLSGFTGNWTPLNGTHAITVIDANTFSVAVNSTTFGTLTGTPVYLNGSAFAIDGTAGAGSNFVDSGNSLVNNLVEQSNYPFVYRFGNAGGNYVGGASCWDSTVTSIACVWQQTTTTSSFIQINHTGSTAVLSQNTNGTNGSTIINAGIFIPGTFSPSSLFLNGAQPQLFFQISGTNYWEHFVVGSGTQYRISDAVNNILRQQFTAAGVTLINSGGSGAIQFNLSAASGTGTGGVQFGSGGASPTTVASVNGAGLGTFSGGINSKTYTVSTLPSASSLAAGTQLIVTDASTFTPGTCTGSGSDYMIAVTNGTTWSCH